MGLASRHGIFGAATYLLVGWIGLLELRPLIGSDKKQRLIHAVRLTKVPYFAGGILACVAGALNPDGLILGCPVGCRVDLWWHVRPSLDD